MNMYGINVNVSAPATEIHDRIFICLSAKYASSAIIGNVDRNIRLTAIAGLSVNATNILSTILSKLCSELA